MNRHGTLEGDVSPTMHMRLFCLSQEMSRIGPPSARGRFSLHRCSSLSKDQTRSAPLMSEDATYAPDGENLAHVTFIIILVYALNQYLGTYMGHVATVDKGLYTTTFSMEYVSTDDESSITVQYYCFIFEGVGI